MNPKDLVGAKKAPLRYVPSAVVIEASGPMEDGAIKYGPFNWRDQPVEMVTYLEAIERHLMALKDGQDNAEDSGHSHLGHIIAGAGIIADAKANGTLIDNRFAAGPAPDMLRERDKSARPAESEPVVYPTPISESDAARWSCIYENRHTDGEHFLECPDFNVGPSVTVEPWGVGDGAVMRPLYIGTPREDADGCYEYRGRHVHPTVATPETFRSIDRDMALSERLGTKEPVV
jgi:hypothetical protein